MHSSAGDSGSAAGNGLTPSYDHAPEISHNHHQNHDHLQHHHHHDHHEPSQADYGYGTMQTSYVQPQSWMNTNQLYAQNNQAQSPNSNNSFAAVIRSIFVVMCFVFMIGLGISFYSSEVDNHPHNPWPPSGSSPAVRPHPPPPQPHRTIEERVKSILQSTPLIDGHDDLAIFIRAQYKNDIYSDKFEADFKNGPGPGDVDLPRLRAGMNGGAFWSAFVVCPVNASYDMTDENYALEVSHTLEQIDLLRRLQKEYSHAFTSPTEEQASGSGREHMLSQWRYYKTFFGPISIEGLHQIMPSSPMSMLRQYYALGVRMATLTWNCHNPFADAAIVMNSFKEPAKIVNGVFRSEEGAVTKRGRAVIQEMNRIGMIVDISHTSYWTQKAVLSDKITRAPVVFSHSSAYALCPHPRNVRDEILDLVPATKSLVMVNFSPDFVSCKAVVNGTEGSEPYFALPERYDQNNTLHQVARHIKYIGDRIGYEHVGLGSDFDGMGDLKPKGLEGVDKFPDLVAELLRMGISDENVKGVVGGNILRVWKDVDDVSLQMHREGVLPGVDDGSGY